MAEPLFHPEAQAEYSAAIEWYRERSPTVAARFEAEVERALQLITTEPEMFAKYDEHRRFTLVRRFPYSVVYEIQEGQVQIIAVAHASRRPGYWQDRR